MDRTAALVTCAQRYLAQGESLEDALAHACRRIGAAPASVASARARLQALQTREARGLPT